MHFDILVPADTIESKVIAFGKVYLLRKQLASTALSSKECRFCHMENAPDTVIQGIAQNGFDILEMENCN